MPLCVCGFGKFIVQCIEQNIDLQGIVTIVIIYNFN